MAGFERQPLIKNDFDATTEQLRELVTGVNDLAQYDKLLGTKRDTSTLRRQYKVKRDELTALAKTINEHLRTKRNGPEASRYDRLISQFEQVVKQYEAIVKNLVMKERSVAPQQQDDSQAATNDQMRAQQQQIQDIDSMLKEVHVEDDLIRQNNEDWKNLERDLGELRGMFNDVGTLVYQQGEQLTIAENNVAIADAKVEDGVRNLAKAESYTRKSRSKIVIIVLIILIVIALLIVGGLFFFGVIKI